ncbi:MAG: DUF4199 domain-containing protein [Haliscomenobacteraceae bacterium CHB4]|nr:hypothetical protein [Saprospiraceae bacterium]MCE7925428.1 DUF4199 domain-containing protein [Haliscomenobacteraceae bacterium CHB4]
MSTLDSPSQQLPNVPIWDTILRYGAYCTGGYVVMSLLMYLINFNMMSIGGMVVFYITLFAVGFVFAVMAMRHQRDQLDGGYISYGKALLVGLLTVFIGVFVSGLWNYVLINFIDPNYVANLKERFVESWGERMPPEALEKALEGFDKAGDLGSILMNGLTGGAIYGLIIGLIAAAFMKKQPEISIR